MPKKRENPRLETFNKLIKAGKSSEKDILNLQFAIGIIQCLMMFIDKNNISVEDKKEIVDIINELLK